MIAEIVFSSGSLTVLFLLFVLMQAIGLFIYSEAGDKEDRIYYLDVILTSIILSAGIWSFSLLVFVFFFVLKIV